MLDLRLGEFIEQLLMMTEVWVYDTYDESLVYHDRIGGIPKNVVLENGESADDYHINHMSADGDGLKIWADHI